jgi:hypothetical protein
MPFSASGWRLYSRRKQTPLRLTVEALEDRSLLDAHTISGFVFNDLNNNGLRDPGEAPLANSSVELRNASGQVVGQTITDMNGYYEFDRDQTVSQNPLTLTHILTFAAAPTDFEIDALLAQFDPNMGTLLEANFDLSGFIRSKIWAENLSTASGANITGTVTGSLTLMGGGLNTSVSTTPVQQQFSASKYDGLTDYAGTSGKFFGERSSSGSGSITIGNGDGRLQNFIGEGTVNLMLMGEAHSTAKGGGNVTSLFDSNGGGTVTVTYRYRLSDDLQPGTYTVVQTGAPSGMLDGKESRNGTVLPNSVGTDIITVILTNQDATNNNFAEVMPAQVCGAAYIDGNNDGNRDLGETGIAGVVIVLTGTDDRGKAVRIQQSTDIDGDYCFTGLRPGTYTIKQTPPVGFLPGQLNAPGTLGGQAQVNCFTSIQTPPGAEGSGYDFSWLKPSTLTGYVYADANQNGEKDAGEKGLGQMRVVLSGVDDLGNQVRLVRITNAQGFYKFVGLRPGTYTLTQTTKPLGFRNGENSVGSLGGGLGVQQINDILVGVGVFGQDYNFGKVRTAAAGGNCGWGGAR